MNAEATLCPQLNHLLSEVAAVDSLKFPIRVLFVIIHLPQGSPLRPSHIWPERERYVCAASNIRNARGSIKVTSGDGSLSGEPATVSSWPVAACRAMASAKSEMRMAQPSGRFSVEFATNLASGFAIQFTLQIARFVSRSMARRLRTDALRYRRSPTPA